MRRQALRVVLSEKFRDGQIRVIDSWKLDEMKTKQVAKAFTSLGIEGSVFSGITKEEEETKRAMTNIPDLNVKFATDMNVMDVLHHKTVILSEGAIRDMENRLKKV
jgi:large subunit ribosomal protein L4